MKMIKYLIDFLILLTIRKGLKNQGSKQLTNIPKIIEYMAVTILAIESSCDDTSVAVIRDGYVLSNLIASQEIHKSYGGVVPELASRAHQSNIVPVIDQAVKTAGIGREEISAVAFTCGPGPL